MSIFLGGGTPSLFSASGIKKLLSMVKSRIDIERKTEITLEANPCAIDSERFVSFREAGINRLSLGVQSFNDNMLRGLGRIHDAKDAMDAIKLAKIAGFEKINLDLMYGLPQQEVGQVLDDLAQAVTSNPKHLSWYQLTVEPNTVFFKHRPLLPPEDNIWAMQEQGRILIAEAGFKKYEISSYAKSGHKCNHNLNYWEFGDYIGVGSGAHSKLTDISKQKATRFVRHRQPERYISLAGDESVITETKILTESDNILEFMMNALRLTNGVKISLFEQRTGIPMDRIQQSIKHAEVRGWLEVSQTRIKPTTLGHNYLNDLLQCFMSNTEDICYPVYG